MPTPEYLLVGQGLAGSLLADALLRRGQRVRVLADARASSSGVAAGLFNPVTGRKPQTTWLANALFPYLHRFYPALEKSLGARFFHPMPLYRPFGPVPEVPPDPALNPYLRLCPDPAVFAPWVQGTAGGLLTSGAGWVDVPAFLAAFRQFLAEKGFFEETTFRFADLEVGEKGVRWRNRPFTKIVFCEGVYATQNPFFDWLPLTPVKGETLTLRLAMPSGLEVPPGIVNRGVWLLPRPDGLCRVGATYTWNPLDWEPSGEGRAFLEEKVKRWLRPVYEVTGHEAGLRPAVQNRRPLLGMHPVYGDVGIFNGLGSKGVSLAPFFADQLAAHLVEGKELDEAVNISRYFSLYSGR